MTNDLPFLAFSRALERTPRAGHLQPGPDEPTLASGPAAFSHPTGPTGEVSEAFDAAVSGVQTGFKHLSREDIKFPPQHWFDATLARQIAIHIAIRQHQLTRSQVARELERNRGQIGNALKKVEQRLRGREFAAAYADMAARAAAVLREREGDKE